MPGCEPRSSDLTVWVNGFSSTTQPKLRLTSQTLEAGHMWRPSSKRRRTSNVIKTSSYFERWTERSSSRRPRRTFLFHSWLIDDVSQLSSQPPPFQRFFFPLITKNEMSSERNFFLKYKSYERRTTELPGPDPPKVFGVEYLCYAEIKQLNWIPNATWRFRLIGLPGIGTEGVLTLHKKLRDCVWWKMKLSRKRRRYLIVQDTKIFLIETTFLNFINNFFVVSACH